MLSEPSTKTVITDGAGAQLLGEMEHTITVKARGNSLKDMVNTAFQIMRKRIFQEIDKPIIQLEAKEVYSTNWRRRRPRSTSCSSSGLAPRPATRQTSELW